MSVFAFFYFYFFYFSVLYFFVLCQFPLFTNGSFQFWNCGVFYCQLAGLSTDYTKYIFFVPFSVFSSVFTSQPWLSKVKFFIFCFYLLLLLWCKMHLFMLDIFFSATFVFQNSLSLFLALFDWNILFDLKWQNP